MSANRSSASLPRRSADPRLLRWRRTVFVRCAAALLALTVTVPAFADWQVKHEHWFEMLLGGQPCGYAHLRVEEDGDQLRTTTVSEMRLARDSLSITVKLRSEFIETAAGAPISATTQQEMGGAPIVTTFTFRRDGADWTAEVQDSAGVRTVPLPGTWLTPQATERFITERIKAGAKTIEYRSVETQALARIMTTVMTLQGEGKATIPAGVVEGRAEREVDVSIWSSKNDLLNIPSIEKRSIDGITVEAEQKMPIGNLKTRLVTERQARAALTKGKVEVLVKSFVVAPVPITGARERDRMTMRVRSLEGDLQDFPTAGAQSVKRLAPNELEVTVDVAATSPATTEEIEGSTYRAASALIDSDAPVIKNLLKKVGPRPKDQSDMERADELRRFVFRHIDEKNLGTAFASASETAKSRSGDCSEHAVLLAALLRADGIPSRVASGLVYADAFAGERNVWGWHVWTQACVKERDGKHAWIDVDATLPTRFDAAHVMTGISELAGGATDPMWTSSLTLLGNLAITVVDPAPSEAPATEKTGKPATTR